MSRRRRRSQRQRAVAYFDRRAPDWSAAYEAPTAAGHALRERRRRVLELVGESGGDGGGDGDGTVLDVGCGTADLAPGLSSAGWQYFGTDGAPAMVRAAKDAGIGADRVTVADVSFLPHAPASFDRVLCIGVLDRVADQAAAVAELVRVTRPGGRVVASFPNPFSPYTAWSNWVFRPAVGGVKAVAARAGDRPRPPGLDAAAFACTPRAATAMFEGAGAAVTGVVHFYFNVVLSPLDEVLVGAAARLTGRLEHLHQGRLAFLGAGFLVAGRRRG